MAGLRRNVGGRSLGLDLGLEAQIAGRLLQGVEQLSGVVAIQQASGQRGSHVDERRLHRVQVLQRRQQQLKRLALGEGARNAHLLPAQAQMAVAIGPPAQRRNLAVNAVFQSVAAELDAGGRLFAIRHCGSPLRDGSPFAGGSSRFAFRPSPESLGVGRCSLFAVGGSPESPVPADDASSGGGTSGCPLAD